MSELTSKYLAAVARRWIEDYRRAPSIKQGWRLVRILERVLADRVEVERAAAEKAWTEGELAGTRNQRDFEQYRQGRLTEEGYKGRVAKRPNPYRRNEGENDGRE